MGGKFAPGDGLRQDAGQVITRPNPASMPSRRYTPAEQRHQFDVVREVPDDIANALMKSKWQTVHSLTERIERMSVSDPGDVYRSFMVDRGLGDDKAEIHVVTENAEVHIFSARTGRLITMLYARPQQVVRYFGRERVAESVMNKARLNVSRGRNLT